MVRNVDLETYFDGRTTSRSASAGDLEDKADHDVRWSNMSHVTIRSAPGSLASIRSRIWIDQTSTT